jgi:hypothetical protein
VGPGVPPHIFELVCVYVCVCVYWIVALHFAFDPYVGLTISLARMSTVGLAKAFS